MGIVYIKGKVKQSELPEIDEKISNELEKIFSTGVSCDMVTNPQPEDANKEQSYYMKLNIKAIKDMTPFVESQVEKLLQRIDKNIELIEDTPDIERFFKFKKDHVTEQLDTIKSRLDVIKKGSASSEPTQYTSDLSSGSETNEDEIDNKSDTPSI